MGWTRTAAAAIGALYLFLGIVGFVLASPLFGLFAVNALHNVLHVFVGAALLYGAASPADLLAAARGVGSLLLGIGALGFVTPDGFGLVPLGGHAIWLHLSTGAALLALSFFVIEPADVEGDASRGGGR